ncbi:hypothetical protein [Chryseobacterium daecheongense]|uniref:Uncharacterized protein n=1 Tax=Chryseobacterium daecheongense TaxID=192389 RepID=A0A3N0W2U2_9FLAO|nr:hypothetical protein [Chryseobacterium daecheongense]ROH99381.1 hypothetical protein EGI05_00340 [Chryseobacterium daecheongense]TDX95723.1 hypothetical protein BCF50_1506 [Chryseobacterium daecheongense]
MRKKFFYASLVIIVTVISYVAYKSIIFSKYSSKLEVSRLKPEITLENLLNAPNLKVEYLKSFNYDKKHIGFNAIVNGQHYITVTKLGGINDGLSIHKSLKDFKENNNMISFPPDFDEQVARYFGFYDYPFNITNIKYYIDGKELQNLNGGFTEIVFKGNYLNISFNNKERGDFIYSTPKEEMSVSFISYNNELYAINTKIYKNYPFKSLHSLIQKNNQNEKVFFMHV